MDFKCICTKCPMSYLLLEHRENLVKEIVSYCNEIN